jgi:hypothetical protein
MYGNQKPQSFGPYHAGLNVTIVEQVAILPEIVAIDLPLLLLLQPQLEVQNDFIKK